MMLGISSGGANNPSVRPWIESWDVIAETLSAPEIGKKDGAYFTIPTFKYSHRSGGNTQFPLQGFVLDGDSTIDLGSGELREGAPPPEYVHDALVEMDIQHLIFTTHSHGTKGNRYRVLIPVEINTPEEHASCVDWTIDQLHQKSVMLAGVTENHTIALAWYLPRIRKKGAPFYFSEHDDNCQPFPLYKATEWYQGHQHTIEEITVEPSSKPRDLDPAQPIDHYNLNHGISDVVKLLQDHDYLFTRTTRINNELAYCLTAPSSESGSAGVNVWIGKTNKKVMVCSHHGNHDPLVKIENGKRAPHDAFGVFTVLEHQGNQKIAVREWSNNMNQSTKRKFTFEDFSMTGKSKELLAKMENDIYVLGRMAIKGQSTLFYADTNAGKTLLTIYLLIESIKNGEINPKNVFYLNADDHGKGFAQKLQLAEKYGFHMTGIGCEGNTDTAFNPDMLQALLEERIEAGEAGSCIVILDTAKKFVDHMNKKEGRNFGIYTRPFIINGGTMIMLSHTNKHKDNEGKSVYSGTTDLIDDADCAYTLEVSDNDSNIRTVTFEHQKSRGDVVLSASYRYNFERGIGRTYFDLLDSVKPVSKEDADRDKMESQRRTFTHNHRHIIDEVVACIRGGISIKTELIKEVADRTTEPRRKVGKVVNQCTGEGSLQFWKYKVGEHNSQIYSLNEQTRKFGAII